MLDRIDRSLLHDEVMQRAAAALNDLVWTREQRRREAIDGLIFHMKAAAERADLKHAERVWLVTGYCARLLDEMEAP